MDGDGLSVLMKEGKITFHSPQLYGLIQKYGLIPFQLDPRHVALKLKKGGKICPFSPSCGATWN